MTPTIFLASIKTSCRRKVNINRLLKLNPSGKSKILTMIMQPPAKANFIVFALVFLFASCSKEGPQGPAGPQGEPGAQGVTGAPGDKGNTGVRGPKGDKGTANVLYSDWMNLNWNLTDDPTAKEMYVHDSKITNAFFEKGGMVLGYLRTRSVSGKGTSVTPLPHFVNSNVILEVFSISDFSSSPSSEKQGIVFDYYSLTGDALGLNLHDNQDFDYDVRYILIPGGVHLRIASAPPDYKNYAALCLYYGIPE